MLNGRASVSPEMALRLAKAFDTTPESWLGMQMEYDLWQTEKRAKRLQVKRLAAWAFLMDRAVYSLRGLQSFPGRYISSMSFA